MESISAIHTPCMISACVPPVSAVPTHSSILDHKQSYISVLPSFSGPHTFSAITSLSLSQILVESLEVKEKMELNMLLQILQFDMLTLANYYLRIPFSILHFDVF